VNWSVVVQSGPGAGQVRTIIASTANQLTVGTAFATTPTAASVYRIVKAPEPITGAPGVDVTTWGTNWLGATAWNPSTTTAPLVTANAEWQVCFKCHSSANANVAAWDASFTDLAVEFNTSNASYHPVVGALPATDPGANGSSRLNSTQLINGWQPGDLMTCTDCHNADTASPAAQGPHGSAIKYMLAGVNKAWPYTLASQNGGTAGTPRQLNSSETGLGTNDGLFCRNCHPSQTSAGNTNNFHTNSNLTGGQHGGSVVTRCTACHIRVPHGGKVSRLILTSAAPARYQTTGVTVNFVRFLKAGTFSGYGTIANNFGSTCGQHSSGASTGEAW
jgi:hypothetical protein